MNPKSVSYSTTGSKEAIAIDWRIAPVNVGYAVIVPNGVTTSVTLDHTYDNVNDPSVTPVWIASTAITATTEGTIAVPFQFVRLTIASISGGAVTLKLNQATQIGVS